MKRKNSHLRVKIESATNLIYKLVKVRDKIRSFDKHKMQVIKMEYKIYQELLDLFELLVDNEYYNLTDRFIKNCICQNVDMDHLLITDCGLGYFMLHFRAKHYTKLNYYLKNGFDLSIDENWFLFFVDENEYYEVMNYIKLYNRRMKIERIRLKM